MKLTVLFSSAGRRVELMQCFRADAKELGLDLRVLAVDLNPAMSPACQVADKSIAVARCTETAFIPQLLEVCAAEKVSLVIPTIDTELETLAINAGRFGELNTRVAVSSAEVVRLARNKIETIRFFARHGIPTPRTAPLDGLLSRPADWRWPVVLKPIDGSSSIGVHTVETLESARALAIDRARYLAQEKWQGCEHTVNVFFDREGRLRCAVPHLRCEIRAGEVSKGITGRHPALMAAAARLGEVLPGARAALCFQAIVTPQGEAAVFEINARFGGGYPLAHRAGANFSKWLLEETAGLPCSAHDRWQEHVVMLRYDAAVFRTQSS